MPDLREILRRIRGRPDTAQVSKGPEGANGIDQPATSVVVRGDNPIRRTEDDTLGRSSAARSFARQVLGLDASEGIVVGVLGPWGSGKTSFVNLARPEFERANVPILEFNPWMFSGTKQLVESFFVELSAQLGVREGLAELGKDLENYGEAFSGIVWLPFIGPWLERGRGAMKSVGNILQRRKEGVSARRAKLERALTSLDKPILVFLDDIDRLSTSEIRDIFRLVRLTASFPNMVYVVAFDRIRVESALAEQGVPGRAYLEKILQVAIDLPAVPENVLSGQILSGVDSAIAKIENPGPFDEARWPDVFVDVIRPLIRNMRDVRRYAAASKGTVDALEGQIALVDVLALEAVRLFLPDVFTLLHGSIDGLTKTSSWSVRESPQLKTQFDALVQAGETHADVVRAMVKRLFPAAERHGGGSHYGSNWGTSWLRDRRVAHEDILRLYLERVTGEGLRTFRDTEKAWPLFADRNALDGYLRSLEKERLQEVIASLETYEDQFSSPHAVPSTIVLLNLQPDLPKKPRGMLELDSRFTVSRVVLRLLRVLRDPAAVEAAVHQIIPELTTLSSKLELILLVGHRENVGHKLVSETAASEFERSWRAEVRAAPVERLLKEWDLTGVMYVTKHQAQPSEESFKIDNSPELTLALLRASRGEIKRQTFGGRSVHRTPQLAWDALVDLYGDEATLRERIESLKATNPKDAGELMELVEKYLEGWRPNPFGE
jgi:hypothetical protein